MYTKCANSGNHSCVIDVQFKIAKWIFVGCIIFSFLLLGYEWYKARAVIKSRDISYTFTNVMANDYYSIKSYNNFCLFCRISSNRQKKDKVAFFVFFTFKSEPPYETCAKQAAHDSFVLQCIELTAAWKRTILADGPRQSINAIILFMIARAYDFSTDDIPQYWDKQPWTALLLISMVMTVMIFLVSLILLIVAAVLYVPLLCYIQGNLKEYVCHKVDKRIGEIIRKSQKKRIARNAAIEKKIEAGGQLVNSKGEVIDASLLKPTLPNISLDDNKPSMSRSNSPAFGRSASPAFGRNATMTRSASPAPGAPGFPPHVAGLGYPPKPHPTDKHRSPEYPAPDSSAAYDDIFDEYTYYSYPPQQRVHDDEYSTSKTSLVAHAAPPGMAPSLAGHGSAHGHGAAHGHEHGPRHGSHGSSHGYGSAHGYAHHAYAPPSRQQPLRPSTPVQYQPSTLVRGAPDFPPSAPHGALDFPPQGHTPRAPQHVGTIPRPPPHQFEAVRQQQWGGYAPPDHIHGPAGRW